MILPRYTDWDHLWSFCKNQVSLGWFIHRWLQFSCTSMAKNHFREACHHRELEGRLKQLLLSCHSRPTVGKFKPEGCSREQWRKVVVKATGPQMFPLLRYRKKVMSSLRPGHTAWAVTSLHLIVQAFYHLTASQEGWVQYMKIFWERERPHSHTFIILL